MPATRTSSRQQLLRNSSEVNPASSPELVARTTSASATKRKRGHAAKPKPVMLGEVIEISSDDEPTPPLNPVLVELRRQVRKLKEENARYKADLAKSDSELLSAREEILGLKALPTHGKGKLVLDISQLEDNVNCEICTLRMWSPFILPECGHTFCQSCLQDWFDTTLAQFMTAHPHYDVNDPVPNNLRQWQAMMHSPHVVQNPHTAAYITQMLRQTPQPDYTCPTCREAVKNRPVEDFTLKALVRTVATATGDASPRKPEKPGRVAKASISRESGPWDIFFPRAT
ncbi:hypothetical protein D9615_002359 [Tricholomella constricta]|uniref:RING-type domain-containing protein n=1 Tax=Tricholomella constricta TaxID=117010 RepID=A0A8H5HML9_9AGAR|nr:hypothetical protein D9615_002359 [Tricholomella constricta]